MLCSKCFLKYIRNSPNIFGKTKEVCRVLWKFRRNFSKPSYKSTNQKLIINQARTMKIDSPEFRSCITEEVIILKDLFTKYGHEIRIVGGAVRDLLLGVKPLDLDFSTTATPMEMKQMFEENKFRLINTNGEKHGTITTRINDKNFEVTTLRIDLFTNGRHAVVEFTKNWALDANRRDLTINAMYLGLDGTLYDYFNGYEDLKNKRLVFVGSAEARIKEDYLRILRYFRFYGRIAEVPDSHDEDVLKAIRDNVSGLSGISGERIWIEIVKIFQGRFAGDIMLKMQSVGIFPHLGIPDKPGEGEFRRVWDLVKMKDLETKPITLLIAFFKEEEEFNEFVFRMKLANADRDLGYFILKNREEKMDPTNPLRKYKIRMLELNRKKYFVYELLKYQGKFHLLDELTNWKIPPFPVKGYSLTRRGFKGKAVGEIMNNLRQVWYERDFNMSEEELLKHVFDVNGRHKE